MRFEVVPSELRAVAGALRATADEVHSMLGPTGTSANQSAAVIGQPEAADALLELWARWSRRLDELVGQLNQVAVHAAHTADVYEDADLTAMPLDGTPGPSGPAAAPPGGGR